MPLIAAPARPGNWLDTDQPISDAVLEAVAAAGYEGVYRYVGLPGNSPAWDISPGELSRICGTRRPDGLTLQCGLVQHPRSHAHADLTQHKADDDATCAVTAARAAGYPVGAHVCLDFEDLGANTRSTCVAFAVLWAETAIALEARAQLYVGFDVPLDPDQLYALPGFDSYWSDAGHRKVSTRGCAMQQSAAVTIHGITFDRNVLLPDLLGGVPIVAQAA